MWIINNIENILYLPCTSNVYLSALFLSGFFTIYDIREHTKLVSHVPKVVINWRLQGPDPEHMYIQMITTLHRIAAELQHLKN